MHQSTSFLLYYARVVDRIVLKHLNNLSAQQIQITELTANAIINLLNLCYTYPNTGIKYYTSDKILHGDSDASCLSLPKTHSCTGGSY